MVKDIEEYLSSLKLLLFKNHEFFTFKKHRYLNLKNIKLRFY